MAGGKQPKKWPPKGFPLVEGKHQLTDQWMVELPSQFARRIEEGSLVLWRPGLTIWLDAWGNDHRSSRTARLREIRSNVSERATDVEETAGPKLSRLTYRLRDTSPDGEVDSIYNFVFSDAGHLQMAIYFDDPADVPTAYAIAASVGLVGP
ncbi:MAG TPA: hypothetical protein VFQ53_19320 [Kofleriaceae bacterium]|nr:hypothetical protein [Kofleriaceae bacterium]